MTVPYLDLPGVINMDILEYLVCSEFHASQFLTEVAMSVRVPRSIVSIEEGVIFRYRETRDELDRRLSAETVMHNRIRTMVSKRMQANLILSSHLHTLRCRAAAYW